MDTFFLIVFHATLRLLSTVWALSELPHLPAWSRSRRVLTDVRTLTSFSVLTIISPELHKWVSKFMSQGMIHAGFLDSVNFHSAVINQLYLMYYRSCRLELVQFIVLGYFTGSKTEASKWKERSCIRDMSFAQNKPWKRSLEVLEVDLLNMLSNLSKENKNPEREGNCVVIFLTGKEQEGQLNFDWTSKVRRITHFRYTINE